MNKTQCPVGFVHVPLDRISRDASLWLRAHIRLQKAGLLKPSQKLKLFVKAS